MSPYDSGLTKWNNELLSLVIMNRGLQKLILKYWRFGSREIYESFVLSAQIKKLQRYIPDITLADIERQVHVLAIFTGTYLWGRD